MSKCQIKLRFYEKCCIKSLNQDLSVELSVEQYIQKVSTVVLNKLKKRDLIVEKGLTTNFDLKNEGAQKMYLNQIRSEKAKFYKNNISHIQQSYLSNSTNDIILMQEQQTRKNQDQKPLNFMKKQGKLNNQAIRGSKNLHESLIIKNVLL